MFFPNPAGSALDFTGKPVLLCRIFKSRQRPGIQFLEFLRRGRRPAAGCFRPGTGNQLDQSDLRQCADEFTHFPDFFHRIIDVRQHGNADDRRCHFRYPQGIFLYDPAASADVSAKNRFIQGLQLQINQIRRGDHRPEGRLLIGVTRRDDGRMPVLLPAGLENFRGEAILGQRIAAGQGNAAAGAIHQCRILSDAAHDLLDRHSLSPQPQGPRRADGRTIPAATALEAFSRPFFQLRRHAPWAGIPATAALDAFLLFIKEGRPDLLSLPAGAPPAGQGTALQFHDRADARAVIQGKAPDIQHDAFRLIINTHMSPHATAAPTVIQAGSGPDRPRSSPSAYPLLYGLEPLVGNTMQTKKM